MGYSCSVFFFKQKTAYEMRISDWSSDVCSSDLVRLALGPDALIVSNRRVNGGVEILATDATSAEAAAASAAPMHSGAVSPPEGDTGVEESGRAAWRERVCQYV